MTTFYRVQVSKTGIKGVSDFKVFRMAKSGLGSTHGVLVDTVRARVPKRGMTRAQVVTAKRRELIAIWEAKEILNQ